MSKRYYVCDVIGDGSEESPYRPKIADQNVARVTQMSFDDSGTLTKPWALVLVDTINHARLSALPGIDQLPDVSLDIKKSAISTASRSQLSSMLSRRDISSVNISSTDSYKNIINDIGKSLDASFTADNFDVA